MWRPEQTIAAWTDDKLAAVIARLRRDSARRPDKFALLMFLGDARLRHHEVRAFTDVALCPEAGVQLHWMVTR